MRGATLDKASKNTYATLTIQGALSGDGKNDEKCFLFHLKCSFYFQDIF